MTAQIRMPRPMRQLPRVGPGYPVPWFVAWIDGKPDFRVVAPGKIAAAVNDRLCWVCGQRRRGKTDTFLIGPMCAVNRTSAEPPSHYDCAVYSAMVCPFMANPNKERRETNKPEGAADPAGLFIKRNPGVGLVWTTATWRPFRVEGGVLFYIGTPRAVEWFAHGRVATRSEVEASIESGCPILRKVAEEEGPDAVAEFDRRVTAARKLLPASPSDSPAEAS